MTMFGSQWLANAGADYEISQSIRFNDDDSAFLARTPLASNRKTWTFSAWVKRADLFNGSVPQIILSAGDGGSNDFIMQFGQSDDTLRISDYEGSTQSNLITSQRFRDVSAWYHFALVYDTTQGTEANRIKLYVNGSQVTAFGTETYPSQNNDLVINSAIAHNIGRGAYSSNGYFSGYIAEINFVDGTAKSPTDFGEYNDDGVWIPKKYSGAYGTNGYYLTGADSTALGEDVRISGDQVISYAASQYTGATGSYTYSNGRLEADTDNKAIRTADTFTGDFEFSWRYNNMANFVIGVYETGEDGTFSDSSSAGNMQNMTDSWYIQTSSVSANRDIFYGGAVQVNATTIADGDTWKMTRSSGTIKLIRNGSDVHTFSQTSTNTVRIAIAQGDAAADLGQVVWVDNSTLGNNFFSSGLAAADQKSDTPTLNASTLNPLWAGAGLSDGNLVATATGNSYQRAISTFAIDDGGKYACEFQKSSGTFGLIGIMQLGNNTVTSGNSNMYGYNVGTGEIFKGNPTASVLIDLGAGAANSLMRVEYDSSADTIKIFDDGVEIFPAATGVSNTVGLTGQNSLHFGCAPYGSGTVITATFQGLSGTPTADFKELTSANLATPSIKDGSEYFHPQLYTGNGSSGLAITNAANAGDFEADLLILAPRSNGDNKVWFDDVRGTTSRIYSNKADPADVDGTAQLTFESNGFDLDTTDVNFNGSGRTYVAWQWKKGATPGFDIVQYTGNKTNRTISHSLGVAPEWIVIKDYSNTESWNVGHNSIGWTKNLFLNLTNGEASSSTIWQDTAPTSSVFSIGTSDGVNKVGSHIAYLWASVAGFSKFGSYTGNGNVDGPFVYTGFKPRWVMIKSTGTESWPILDTARGSGNFGSAAGANGNSPTAGNDMNAVLVMSTNNAEEDNAAGSRRASYLSNGFKVRTTNSAMNSSGQKYVFMAFAEHPFGGDGAAPATAR